MTASLRARAPRMLIAALSLAGAVLVPLGAGGASPALAQAPALCQFRLGFATLRNLVGPPTVGGCLEDERFNVTNGNAEQRTALGMLVWRKADNWTAFTDGHRTWLNGPRGVQQRLNSQRFAWEGDAGAPGTVLVADAPPPAAVPSALPSAPPPAPPIVTGDMNCSDFPSQAAAQAMLRSNPGDPHRLDTDRDGIACESNRAPFDRSPVARR